MIWPIPGGNCEIGNARIVGLSGAVRDDSTIAVRPRHLDAFERLGHRANLVQLDQNGVRNPVLDSLAEERRVGNEIVVSDKLDLIAKLFRNLLASR